MVTSFSFLNLWAFITPNKTKYNPEKPVITPFKNNTLIRCGLFLTSKQNLNPHPLFKSKKPCIMKEGILPQCLPLLRTYEPTPCGPSRLPNLIP